MKEASVPSNERERLEALYSLGILDTPQEERFDRITRIAQAVFDVPIALISLVDTNRQWYKSCQGLSDRETPRGVSFCAHAILQDNALVIPDALSDGRFADNPLVTGPPNIRFYAGQPLFGPGRHKLGTLCIIGRNPRCMSPEDLEILSGLAHWVETEINSINLSERLAVERELERSRHRSELILKSALEGIYGCDVHGVTTFVNEAAAHILGYEVDELLGKRMHDLVHYALPGGEPYPWSECPIYDTLTRGTSEHTAGDTFWRKDGTSFPVEWFTSPMIEDERIVGGVISFQDISDRQAIQRVRDEFISVVSHELRTPLTSIRGSLGLLAGGVLGPLSDDAQHMADIAVNNVDRLVRLINDILDIERMESSLRELQCCPFEAQPVVQHAVETMEAMAANAGVTLTTYVPSLSLWGDSDRLAQLITNLVSNAIKFSPSGGTVTVSAEPHGTTALFKIKDQGRGIPPEKLDSIFHRFVQVDAGDAREKGGTGLGLPIARAIVQQHGGTIWVESSVGRGSTFLFTLPLQDGGGAGAS